MYGYEICVGVMGWNKYFLFIGFCSGLVFNYDVCIVEYKVVEFVFYIFEVCGFEWCFDGVQFVIGGNDNFVFIWDVCFFVVFKFIKINYKVVVKVFVWCLWNMNFFVIGGGLYDCYIYFWNIIFGVCVNSIDIGFQVISFWWSFYYCEIVSLSGFFDNFFSIWSYFIFVCNVEIFVYESRVFYSCFSFDGQMLVIVVVDESLKFWKVFEKKVGVGVGVGSFGLLVKVGFSKQMMIC